MLKRAVGVFLFYMSWPLILVGATLFVLNVLIASSNLGHKTTFDFLNGLVMVGVGFVCRIIGDRLRRIRW